MDVLQKIIRLPRKSSQLYGLAPKIAADDDEAIVITVIFMPQTAYHNSEKIVGVVLAWISLSKTHREPVPG